MLEAEEYRDSAVDSFFNISDLVKKGIIVFLILLPFQGLPKMFFDQSSESIILKAIAYSDEIITLLLFIVLLTYIFVKPEFYRLGIMGIPTSVPLFLFILTAGISILWNGVSIDQGFFGVYDVIKNIILLYLFASLRWERKELLTLISGIKVVIVILAIAGIAGEILALINLEPGYLTSMKEKRLGLYRVMSLTGKGNINYLGMYALLGLFLFYLTTNSKFKKISGVFLSFCLIFLTFSRQVWMGLFVMAASIERRLILPSLLVFLGVIVLMHSGTGSYDPIVYYRSFTYGEALKIFLEHPIIGSGAGMFGGVASVLFDSSYYHNWPVYYRDMIYRMGSLDAFWPTILAELGLLGFILYFIIFIALHNKINGTARWFKHNNDLLLFNIGTVLKNYIVALVIMCFATGLNKPFVIYSFMALCGIYLSVFIQEKHRVI
jgi:hypothetical protein